MKQCLQCHRCRMMWNHRLLFFVAIPPELTMWPTSILSVVVAVERFAAQGNFSFVTLLVLFGWIFLRSLPSSFMNFHIRLIVSTCSATVSSVVIYSTGSYLKQSWEFIVICQTFCIYDTHNVYWECATWASHSFPHSFIELVREELSNLLS